MSKAEDMLKTAREATDNLPLEALIEKTRLVWALMEA